MKHYSRFNILFPENLNESQVQPFAYAGEAKKIFDEISGTSSSSLLAGILNYNQKWRLAWTISKNAFMEFYKPIEEGNSVWAIYHTALMPSGNIKLLDKYGRYGSENDALTAVWREVQEHNALQESWHVTGRDLVNVATGRMRPEDLGKTRVSQRDLKLLAMKVERAFPHKFDEIELVQRSNGTVEAVFTVPLPDGRSEVHGMQQVMQYAVPQAQKIAAFIRNRLPGAIVDVSAVDA